MPDLPAEPPRPPAAPDPPAAVLMEEHCDAWPAWLERGASGMTCVHLDAHFDLSDADLPPHVLAAMARVRTAPEAEAFRSLPTHPWGGFHAGNYLLPALLGGAVARLVWVVPDWLPEPPSTLEWTRRELSRWYHPSLADHASWRQTGPHRVDGTVLGRPLTVCTLDELPAPDAPWLLDVDVDYFLARDDTLSGAPDEIVDALLSRLPAPACVTIARSVHGGYTPMEHRYVGDLLARLVDGTLREPERRAARHLRQGDASRAAGDLDDAGRLYRSALDEPLLAPAARHKLSLSGRPCGSIGSEDAEYHPRPVDLGLLLFRRREHDACVRALREAARETPEWADLCLYLEAAIRLHQGRLRDGTDALGRLLKHEGLRSGERAWLCWLAGRALIAQERIAEARPLLERAVALDGDAPAYHATLGTVLHRAGALDEAARHLRRSVALAPQRVDVIEIHQELVRLYREAGQPGLAEAESRRLAEKVAILGRPRAEVPAPSPPQPIGRYPS